MTARTNLFFILVSFFSFHPLAAQTKPDTANIRTLIVFFDGLRPDYITPENMPNIYAFSRRGCYGMQHHSVFPTVTRVNSSSYSTGSYPATHGLMGNTVYFPEVDKIKGLNTGEASELNRITAATHGRLLTTVSLGEILQRAGATMMVFSSGSSGQALLQNHTVSGGAVVNTSMILPESLRPTLVKALGPIPPHEKPNTPQHRWVTDALIKYGLTPGGPLVSAIWFSDPDGAAHSDGIGSPAAMQSIRSVDEQFGRIIAALEEKGLTQYFNVIVSTDHGFVTHMGKESLGSFLIQQGLKKDTASEDVVVAEGALYVKGHDAAHIEKIVSALQQQPWIGALFTKGAKAGDMQGSVKGTLSFESIHWNHPDRAADILVDADWTDGRNAAGYAGMSYSRGVAGHGGMSPYEVHIPLIASGPSFRQAFHDSLPTSNVDIAPTVLHIHHIPVPATMDGRVLSELLKEPSPPLPAVRQEVIKTEAEDGVYKLQLHETIMGRYRYIDYSKVERGGK